MKHHFLRHRFLPASILFVAAASCAPPVPGPFSVPTTTAAAPVTAPATAPATTAAPAHTPVINSFTASRPSGASPLTTSLAWSISDPDGAALSCAFDLDSNGSAEITINPCAATGSRTRSFINAGVQQVTLRVSNASNSATATVGLTIGTASADTFDITLRLSGSMSPSQTAIFNGAVTRWQSVVSTGLTSQTLNIGSNYCGTGAAAFSGTVDDLLIDASITTIDGPGGILGQAGPCLTRNSNGLPIYGVMKFDSADVASLESSGQFDETILHEMGHVLGIGTVWNSSLLTGAGTSDPRFVGASAVGAWNELGGSGSVPVENTGGAGTADSHWRESVFGNELMTGWLDTVAPLSQLTSASLADIGYGVNIAASDAYTRPGALRVLSVRRPPVGEMVDVEIVGQI